MPSAIIVLEMIVRIVNLLDLVSNFPVSLISNGVLPDTDTDNSDQDRYNHYSAQWESVMMSVSVQYQHLHTILYNPFFIGLGVCVGVYQMNAP